MVAKVKKNERNEFLVLWQNIPLYKKMDIFCQNRRQIFVNEVNKYELMHEIANLLLVVNEFTSLHNAINNLMKICHINFVKRVDPLHHLLSDSLMLSQHNFPVKFIMYARKKRDFNGK